MEENSHLSHENVRSVPTSVFYFNENFFQAEKNGKRKLKKLKLIFLL